jgi:hypothetical protein
MYEKYEKEMRIKRKIEEKNRLNKKHIKKSHKKKEKYIALDENYTHRDTDRKLRNNEETDEDIIITSNLFRKDDERNDESTDNVKIVKEVIESSRLNEEDYDITLTENENNRDFSESNNKQD